MTPQSVKQSTCAFSVAKLLCSNIEFIDWQFKPIATLWFILKERRSFNCIEWRRPVYITILVFPDKRIQCGFLNIFFSDASKLFEVICREIIKVLVTFSGTEFCNCTKSCEAFWAFSIEKSTTSLMCCCTFKIFGSLGIPPTYKFRWLSENWFDLFGSAVGGAVSMHNLKRGESLTSVASSFWPFIR